MGRYLDSSPSQRRSVHHIRDILAISAHQPHHPNELYAKQWYASVATVQSAVIDLLRGTRRVRHIVGHHQPDASQKNRIASFKFHGKVKAPSPCRSIFISVYEENNPSLQLLSNAVSPQSVS